MSAKDLIRYLTSVDGLPTPPDILFATEHTAMLHSPRSDNPPTRRSSQAMGAAGSSAVGAPATRVGISSRVTTADPGRLQQHVLPAGRRVQLRRDRRPGSGERGNLPAERPDPGKSNPPPIACGGTGQPFCGDEATARVIDLIRRIDWPNYDLF